MMHEFLDTDLRNHFIWNPLIDACTERVTSNVFHNLYIHLEPIGLSNIFFYLSLELPPFFLPWLLEPTT